MDAISSKTPTALTLSDDDRALLTAIQRWINKPPTTSRVIALTPTVCFTLLEQYNQENRPRKPGKIAEYRADMAAHEWALTGDTIKFSDAPRLRDGQNRLTACWQARTPFRTHVVFGIPDGFFDRMDRGRNRDSSDLLAIAQHKNPRHLAAAVRWVHLIDSGRIKQRDVLTPRDTLRLVEDKYPDIHEFHGVAHQVYRATGQPPGLVAGLLYLFARKDPDEASRFGAAWTGGNRVAKYQPLALMQAATGRLQLASLGRVHEVVRAAFIVIAWNLVRTKRRGRSSDFNWSLDDEFPGIE